MDGKQVDNNKCTIQQTRNNDDDVDVVVVSVSMERSLSLHSDQSSDDSCESVDGVARPTSPTVFVTPEHPPDKRPQSDVYKLGPPPRIDAMRTTRSNVVRNVLKNLRKINRRRKRCFQDASGKVHPRFKDLSPRTVAGSARLRATLIGGRVRPAKLKNKL